MTTRPRPRYFHPSRYEVRCQPTSEPNVYQVSVYDRALDTATVMAGVAVAVSHAARLNGESS